MAYGASPRHRRGALRMRRALAAVERLLQPGIGQRGQVRHPVRSGLREGLERSAVCRWDREVARAARCIEHALDHREFDIADLPGNKRNVAALIAGARYGKVFAPMPGSLPGLAHALWDGETPAAAPGAAPAVATAGEVSWILPDGRFTYCECAVTRVELVGRGVMP